MEAQVQNAIEIAWNPSSDQNLKAQAFDFLNQLRANPSAWLVCLELFTKQPRAPEIVRHVSLEILNNAVQSQQLDTHNAISAKIGLMDYVRRVYGLAEDKLPNDSAHIQNKLAQTLTFLFTVLYSSGWESFFQDLRQLSDADLQSGTKGTTGTSFYLRMLSSTHDEIADQMIQTTAERAKLNAELKDMIRDRDAAGVASSWQDILSRWQSLDQAVVKMCLGTISRWVSWTDIGLVANEKLLDYLFQIAGQQNTGHPESAQSNARDAAISVFTEIVGKKMKPSEKIELINFLKLETVVERLVVAPAICSARGSPDYDTDMAETVAKLVNNVITDVVEALNLDTLDDSGRDTAAHQLQAFNPHLLRFLADEYDEVCSTIIPALTDQLVLFRKFSKSRGSLPGVYHDMLPPILNALVAKIRYDDTSFWGEEDEETDEAEFQELRKRLKVGQQNVAAVDETLYLNTLSNLVESTFARYRAKDTSLSWRDVEAALLEMYMLGELAIRNAGLYQKKIPSSVASERLISLVTLMMDSDIASFDHPAVHLQLMEICVRYHSFFTQQPQHIPKLLEDFVKFIHSDNVKVRSRSWHFFLRLVRSLRAQLGNIAETIVRAMSDLLVIKAQVPQKDDDDSMSSQPSQSEDMVFQSQLYLFEAVGSLSSVPSVSVENQVVLARSILEPLRNGIQDQVSSATQRDEQAIYQVHHLMEAVGTLARGFSDWVPGKTTSPVPEPVSAEFRKASDTILLVLGSLSDSMIIRSAARFAFSRLVGVLGFAILQQLPQWIDGLLAGSSTRDEMAVFLRLLDQVIFGYKGQIFGILDTLLTPMLLRIFSGFSQPPEGTDDEIQYGELRREYLNFILVLFNNKLDSVLVSSGNQGTFESIIAAIEHFAKDTTELNDGKLAIAVLVKMCEVWGGPNTLNIPNATSASPTVAGFDQFMMTRFSSLTWTIVTSQTFNPKEPQANRILGEISLLQQTILAKNGQSYLEWLKSNELPSLGLQDTAVNEYLHALATLDGKSFKQFLVRFLGRSRD